jgi:hypothetical protein
LRKPRLTLNACGAALTAADRCEGVKMEKARLFFGASEAAGDWGPSAIWYDDALLEEMLAASCPAAAKSAALPIPRREVP